MVEFQDVSLKFGGNRLFDSLSFNLPRGGRLIIQGASGTGKTTLLRMMLGFVLPDKGRILIVGQELNLDNVWEIRQKMAYVSQEMQIGRGRVETFVREIFNYKKNRGISYRRERLLELLEDFQLSEDTIHKKLEDLSGGELQRVAIIVTLLLDREIYLLDEVTSALDQPLKELIVSYFTGLREKTLIISSHDKIWHQQDFSTLNLDKHGSST